MTVVINDYYVDPINGDDASDYTVFTTPCKSLDFLLAQIMDTSDPIYFTAPDNTPLGDTHISRINIRSLGALSTPVATCSRVLRGRNATGTSGRHLVWICGAGGPLILFTHGVVSDHYCLTDTGFQNCHISFTVPDVARVIGAPDHQCFLLNTSLRDNYQGLVGNVFSALLTNGYSFASGCFHTGVLGASGNADPVGPYLYALRPDRFRYNQGAGPHLPTAPYRVMPGPVLLLNFSYLPLRGADVSRWMECVSAYPYLTDLVPDYTVIDGFAGWVNDPHAVGQLAPESVIPVTFNIPNIELAGDGVVGRVLGPVSDPLPAGNFFTTFYMSAAEEESTPGSKAVVDASGGDSLTKHIEIRWSTNIFSQLDTSLPPGDVAAGMAADFFLIARDGLHPPVGHTTHPVFYQYRVTLRTNGA